MKRFIQVLLLKEKAAKHYGTLVIALLVLVWKDVKHGLHAKIHSHPVFYLGK